MFRRQLLIFRQIVLFGSALLVLSTSAVSAIRTGPTGESNGNEFGQVAVNGRTLAGPYSRAERKAGGIFLPVLAVAAALGDTVTIDADARVVKVVRQSGGTGEFAASEGSVSENGSTVLVASKSRGLIVPPNAQELMLPSEVAAALFDAAIRYDAGRSLVVVTRGIRGDIIGPAATSRSVAELHEIDYQYNLNGSSAVSQNLIMTASGRVANGRFRLATYSSGGSGPVSLNQASLLYERPEQTFEAGDIAAGTDLQFVSATFRGASASFLKSGLAIRGFAGRSYSGVSSAADSAPTARPFSRDTTLFGFTGSTDRLSAARRPQNLTYSAGLLSFHSHGRRGTLSSGNLNYTGGRLVVRGEAAFGLFRSRAESGAQNGGPSGAGTITASFQASDSLAFHGRYSRTGRNFLNAQATTRDPVDGTAAGVNWSPLKWMSASVNASFTTSNSVRPADSRQVTTAISVGSTRLPRIYATHTESTSSLNRPASFTLVNATQEFAKIRLYLNATRIKNLGAAVSNVQAGAVFTMNDRTSIEVSQSVGSRQAYGGMADWRTSGLFGGKLNFGSGVGYSRTPAGTSFFSRSTASLELPRRTTLQVNYHQAAGGPVVVVSIRGSLFRKRDHESYSNSPVAEMNSYAGVSGRVYQDTDLNGQYDATIDKPEANAKVRVDGNRYVTTDANGLYKFDSVSSGDHVVNLDLLSVRADLTLLSKASASMNLQAGGASLVDFRLVRTGRVTGRVYFDANENGEFDEDEAPMPDVRIVSSNGSDTLTDSEGNYTIADLPPGEYSFVIDEKTIPEKTMAKRGSISVTILPGREMSFANLTLGPLPAEIKRFRRSNPTY